MRAVEATRPGGPEVLTFTEVPDLVPRDGEVVVKVHAAGVNFIDTYRRSGIYPIAFPHIPGTEGAGTVVAVGPNTQLPIGTRVAWLGVFGSYAEYVVARQDDLVPVPAAVELSTAAALMLQGMTAHYLVRSTFPVQQGTTILITAGAGGVGGLVIQLAKSLGAEVITTVGTAAKAPIARAHGADHVLVLSDMDNLATDIPTHVREIVPHGVDVSYDGIGRDTFDGTLASIRTRGMQVLFGGASGQVPPFDLQRLNTLGSLFITRPTVAHYTSDPQEMRWRAAELFAAVEAGSLTVPVGASYPLEEAALAHAALEGRDTTGKLLLLP